MAWDESVAAAEMLGVIHRPWETPAEFAKRARTAVNGGSFPALAETVGAAEFSGPGAERRRRGPGLGAGRPHRRRGAGAGQS